MINVTKEQQMINVTKKRANAPIRRAWPVLAIALAASAVQAQTTTWTGEYNSLWQRLFNQNWTNGFPLPGVTLQIRQEQLPWCVCASDLGVTRISPVPDELPIALAHRPLRPVPATHVPVDHVSPVRAFLRLPPDE